MKVLSASLTVAAALLLSACSGATGSSDSAAMGDDWTTPKGGANAAHFSRLIDINPGNVGRLGLAWSYDLGSSRVQEATPVVLDGVMYTSGNLGRTYALNAATGEELWTFEPEVDMQANRGACCDQGNRGVAVANGKVMVAALDGWLYALDAKTGKVAWKADTITDHSRGYTITGAPEVAGNLVLIGNAGAEYDARGYVTAYDVATGEQAWRFYTVPHDPAQGPQENPELEEAVKTWSPESRWDIGGGGTVWDAINYDERFGTVIIGVGNAGPYNLERRSPGGGDNLYVASLVALEARTGRVKWHYQETPGDAWDFTSTQPIVFADMDVEGEMRPVLIHAPKNGYMFVLDRETGKPIAINAIVRTSWADGYDMKTGRPKEKPESAHYWKGPKIIFPASPGARNWYPPAYDPDRELYFASVLDMGNLMFTTPPLDPADPHRKKALNIQTALLFTADLDKSIATLPPPLQDMVKALPEWQWVKDKPYSSQIRAIDPMTGKAKWAVDTEGWQDRPGVMATKTGIVFHGSIDGRFIARDAETGAILKEIDTGTAIMAAPMTYRVDGVQYVAVQAGFGGGGWGFVPRYSAPYKYGNANRLLVFKIDGGEVPKPDPLPAPQVAPEPPAQLPGVTPATIARGQAVFFGNCAICHSNQIISGVPDLRRMQPEIHEAFDQIVLEGAFLPMGMPRWDDLISKEDAHAIHAWLIDEQAKVRARELKLKAAGKPLDAPSLTILSSY
ncbi:PQQ-dependent dehydrogenase, methanol/ethanol family [Novosphingobium decolorationis]|uniref:PQQ-dependent dehydrogenase, methanol/ethanol family n=1 Tax=Novosphingobium decolorationis TaxID=2698673 RepID=A0ABX8E5U5_9SPHN|nr:PQQ-dependent dehydrogenase, methanol/ethanol family [Novosphingobium decolorationis]QVM83576.1 PQQ-dependent dehydrogenase, methanol/ethanol family [Novosphingobium decolorationis]